MGIKVCKFGGTSMASGSTILACAKIVQSDEERHYVVVSAPGKRFSDDIKVTDLLYKCSDAVEAGNLAEFKETFEKIRVRFLNIQNEIGKDLGIGEALNVVEKEVLNGKLTISEAFLVDKGNKRKICGFIRGYCTGVIETLLDISGITLICKECPLKGLFKNVCVFEFSINA